MAENPWATEYGSQFTYYVWDDPPPPPPAPLAGTCRSCRAPLPTPAQPPQPPQAQQAQRTPAAAPGTPRRRTGAPQAGGSGRTAQRQRPPWAMYGTGARSCTLAAKRTHNAHAASASAAAASPSSPRPAAAAPRPSVDEGLAGDEFDEYAAASTSRVCSGAWEARRPVATVVRHDVGRDDGGNAGTGAGAGRTAPAWRGLYSPDSYAEGAQTAARIARAHSDARMAATQLGASARAGTLGGAGAEAVARGGQEEEEALEWTEGPRMHACVYRQPLSFTRPEPGVECGCCYRAPEHPHSPAVDFREALGKRAAREPEVNPKLYKNFPWAATSQIPAAGVPSVAVEREATLSRSVHW
eukprot:m51a1_g3688 hypothetical protein (355) ;mRNA; f:340474-341681